jgi:hypothetical protein
MHGTLTAAPREERFDTADGMLVYIFFCLTTHQGLRVPVFQQNRKGEFENPRFENPLTASHD